MMIIAKVLLGVLVAIVCYFIRSILSYESDLKQSGEQLKDQANHENHDHYIFTDAGLIRTTYDYED
jgi:hypothetical protein